MFFLLFHQCTIVIVDVEIPPTISLRIDQMSPMKIFHPQEDQPAPGDAVEELLNFRGDLHIFEVLRIVPGPDFGHWIPGWEKRYSQWERIIIVSWMGPTPVIIYMYTCIHV